MKKHYQKFIYTLYAFVFAFPLVGLAQSGGGLVTCKRGGKYCTLTELIGPGGLLAVIVNFIVTLAVAVSVFGIVYAGFLYLTAGGNTGKIKKGHEVITMTIIGFLIVLLTYELLQVLYTTLGVSADFNPFR